MATQSSTEGVYLPLTEREKELAEEITDIAFSIHRALGPGLLESVYEACFCHELSQRGIPYKKQQKLPIHYNGLVIDGLRMDIVVDDLVIIELKAQEEMHPVWKAQLLSYMRLANKRLGYIINFHVPLMKEGPRRMII